MKTGLVILVSFLIFLVLSIIVLGVYVFQKRIQDRDERFKTATRSYEWNDFPSRHDPFPSVFPYDRPVLPRVFTDFLVIRVDDTKEPLILKGPEGKKVSEDSSLLDTNFAQNFVPELVHRYRQIKKEKEDEAEAEKEKKEKKEKVKSKSEIYGNFVLNTHYATVSISPEHLDYILLLDPEATFKVDSEKSEKNDVVIYSYALGGGAFMYRVKDLPKCVVAYVAVSPDKTHYSDHFWIAYEETCTQQEVEASPMNHIVIRKATADPYKIIMQ